MDRTNLPELYRAFDFPSPDTSSPQRDLTTVPPQALFLMNSRFVRDIAHRVVQRPDVVALPNDAAKLAIIHELLFGRQPTPDELDSARMFLSVQPGEPAWVDFVHALLMTNEFAFVD